jgi:pyruvate ferredoxin oxidoreductase gamma subunit
MIDYDHCKGCMVCVGVCPPHAIAGIPEYLAQQQEHGEAAEGRADGGAETVNR